MYKGEMYDKKSYKSSGGNAGQVKSHSEESYAMVKTGGKKYSHNNPAEMKAKADALVKVLNK